MLNCGHCVISLRFIQRTVYVHIREVIVFIQFSGYLFSLFILKPISLSIFCASFSCFWFDIWIPSKTLMKKWGQRVFWVPPQLHTNLGYIHFAAIGAVPSPFDCYLFNRGLKTLQIRMQKHFENGMAVAQFLESNPLVEKVIFPGMFIWYLSTCPWDFKGYSKHPVYITFTCKLGTFIYFFMFVHLLLNAAMWCISPSGRSWGEEDGRGLWSCVAYSLVDACMLGN